MSVAQKVLDLIPETPDVAVVAYDDSRAGPETAAATLAIRSPRAFQRVVARPGELGFARAYVAGDIVIDGDIYAALEAALGHPDAGLDLLEFLKLAWREAGPALFSPPPPPPEEASLRGRRHGLQRDSEAISHHYDVSNRFYEIILGPSMTYSCAVWDDPDQPLEQAQANKYELICSKLGLEPGDRLLDVGCGWGSMLIHAAQHHGIHGVGITLSHEQADYARERMAQLGLEDRIEIRVQDYRLVDDGPFDAVSSIGMFEHVGRAQMDAYFRQLFGLLRPGGRLLNHGISRPGYPQPPTPWGRAVATARRVATAVGSSWTSRIDSPLMERYVFPDGELHEVGTIVSLVQENGFEVRHLESLREHYALTLRRWVANLEANWDEAVVEIGLGRARVWRLYMAASALGFTSGSLQIHQVLAVHADGGRSGMALRPHFDHTGDTIDLTDAGLVDASAGRNGAAGSRRNQPHR